MNWDHPPHNSQEWNLDTAHGRYLVRQHPMLGRRWIVQLNGDRWKKHLAWPTADAAKQAVENSLAG